MAEGPGSRNYEDYFDIMVIGNTGAGKTTTADKLLLANPTGRVYGYTPEPVEIDDAACGPDAEVSKSFVVSNNDLTMWKTSSEQQLKKLKRRLKDLVFIRDTTDKPHEAINERRIVSEATSSCELISNDTSKVRVLDIPGFFSHNKEARPNDAISHMEAVTINNLATMRTILHIKIALHFKFDRIVYFLPEKGVLRRESEILASNIRLMESYFGRTIFNPMIVVATHDQTVYEFIRPGQDLYRPEHLATTREWFYKAMSSVFPEATPTPPIVFLSFLSSCEEVLSLFKKTIVHGTGVELAFSDSTCSRCNITIQRATRRDSLRNSNMSTHDKNKDSICRYPYTEEPPVQYYDSTCHPMLIPKYTTFDKIKGGIVRILSLGFADKEKWPWFWCCDEKCIDCEDPPGTRGCKRVESECNYGKRSIKVDHSHSIQEGYDMGDS